jgi:hypothetical protein
LWARIPLKLNELWNDFLDDFSDDFVDDFLDDFSDDFVDDFLDDFLDDFWTKNNTFLQILQNFEKFVKSAKKGQI